jgi:hypothetical protein
VTAFTLAAGVDIDQPDLDDHADWINNTAQAIHEGNPNATVYVGPWRLSHLKKGNLEALLSKALAETTIPIAGILIDVDLEISDLGADDLMIKITNIKPVLASIGGSGLKLVFSGLHIPAEQHDSDLPWVRDCPSGVICNQDIQAQLLTKTAIRLLERGHGVGVAGPVRSAGQEHLPGALATSETAWNADDSPVLTPAGIAWTRLIQLTEMGDLPPVDQGIPIQNVYSFSIGAEGLSQERVAWYDWHRESPPGQAYGGIEKTLTLTIPDGAKYMDTRSLTGDEVETPQELGSEFSWEPYRSTEVSGTEHDVQLQDRIIVLSFSEAQITPGDVVSGDTSSDADGISSQDVSTDEGGTVEGGGGCASHNSSGQGGVPWIYVLVGATLYLSRRSKRASV